jgi:hypothetical protein
VATTNGARQLSDVVARCPAAEIVHPVNSLNPDDIRCGIVGHLQPATKKVGNTTMKVDAGSKCCNLYTDCKIWRAELDRTRFGRINRMGGETQVPKHRRASVASRFVGPAL